MTLPDRVPTEAELRAFPSVYLFAAQLVRDQAAFVTPAGGCQATHEDFTHCLMLARESLYVTVENSDSYCYVIARRLLSCWETARSGTDARLAHGNEMHAWFFAFTFALRFLTGFFENHCKGQRCRLEQEYPTLSSAFHNAFLDWYEQEASQTP